MARYMPALDVWALDESARARLQPGQWVTAGPGGPLGRWCGLSCGGVSVAAWQGNARAYAQGHLAYFRALLDYAYHNQTRARIAA